MEHMDTFLYWLLDEAGFTEDDNLQMLHDDLEAALLDRINAKIMEKIPAENHEEAGELLHDEDTAKRESFVHRYIPDYDDYLEQVCDEFAEEYLESMDDESVFEEEDTSETTPTT